jgi:ribosome-associated protein
MGRMKGGREDGLHMYFARETAGMIHISGSRFLDENELRFTFVRSSGPGGQNVNKVSTAVELRFDALASRSLSADEKERLIGLAGKRATSAGVVLIDARNHRTQDGNRQEAVRRLIELVATAIEKPQQRVPTSTPPAARERRRQQKKRRGGLKAARGSIPTDELQDEEAP